MANSNFLVGLIASLVISSVLISLIVGSNAIALSVDTTLQNVNWTGGVNLTKGVDYYDGGYFGGFAPTESGLISTLPLTENDVRFTKSDVDEGVYRHKYIIKKNGIDYFGIIIRDTGYRSDSLRLDFAPGELTLRNNDAMGILIPNSYQETIITDTSGNGDDVIIIETVYDISEKTVNVYIDSVHIAKFTDVPKKSALSILKPTYYGGVSVRDAGFEILAYETNSNVRSVSGFDLFAFLNTLAGVLVWYVSPDIPDQSSAWHSLAVVGDIFINLIIKIQQIGIVAYGIQLARGA